MSTHGDIESGSRHGWFLRAGAVQGGAFLDAGAELLNRGVEYASHGAQLVCSVVVRGLADVAGRVPQFERPLEMAERDAGSNCFRGS